MKTVDQQSSQDQDYIRAYGAWVASLSDPERAELVRLGLDEPDASQRTNTPPITDLDHAFAEDPLARPQRLPSDFEESTDNSSTFADALGAFCTRIRAHPRPMLEFDAACFAIGLMEVQGLSETSLAKRHGIKPAAFSKQAVQFADTFNLPPSRGMFSKRARRSFRRARQRYLEKKVRAHPGTSAEHSPNAMVTFAQGLDQFRRWFYRRTEELPLRFWPAESRRRLRHELSWFKRLYDELAE